MEKIVEQKVCLKFCVANEISCADALKMLKKAYGDSTMSKTRAYEWFSAFKEGREVLEDLPRSGRPSTSTTNDNIEKIKHLVLQNRRFSVRELASEVNIDKMTVHGIITNILHRATHRATIVADYKAKNSVNSVDHPPYSRDLAPCDFFLFPKLKLQLLVLVFHRLMTSKGSSGS